MNEPMMRYEYDCIKQAAERLRKAIGLLQSANTPESLLAAAELQPWVARVEKLA